MCADYAKLEREVRDVEGAGADLIHFDIIDGHYAPNFAGDLGLIRALHRLTSLPLDIHLMCLDPERFLAILPLRPGDRVSFHPDAFRHPRRLLQDIRSRGCLAGLAIRSDLPAGALEDLAPELDYFTVMTIDVGLPGTAFQARPLDKIAKLKSLAASGGGKEPFVQVDGGVKLDNLEAIVKKGADVLILGYPGCFDRDRGAACTMGELRDKLVELGG
jgi:ribulose-phosphate 3-epimerase